MKSFKKLNSAFAASLSLFATLLMVANCAFCETEYSINIIDEKPEGKGRFSGSVLLSDGTVVGSTFSSKTFHATGFFTYKDGVFTPAPASLKETEGTYLTFLGDSSPDGTIYGVRATAKSKEESSKSSSASLGASCGCGGGPYEYKNSLFSWKGDSVTFSDIPGKTSLTYIGRIFVFRRAPSGALYGARESDTYPTPFCKDCNIGSIKKTTFFGANSLGDFVGSRGEFSRFGDPVGFVDGDWVDFSPLLPKKFRKDMRAQDINEKKSVLITSIVGNRGGDALAFLVKGSDVVTISPRKTSEMNVQGKASTFYEFEPSAIPSLNNCDEAVFVRKTVKTTDTSTSWSGDIAVVWSQDKGTRVLNELVDSSLLDGWKIEAPLSINNSGQILVYLSKRNKIYSKSAVLSPIVAKSCL